MTQQVTSDAAGRHQYRPARALAGGRTNSRGGRRCQRWPVVGIDAGRRAEGRPQRRETPACLDLDRFLPWNASPGDLRTWAQPPAITRINPRRTRPHRRGCRIVSIRKSCDGALAR